MLRFAKKHAIVTRYLPVLSAGRPRETIYLGAQSPENKLTLLLYANTTQYVRLLLYLSCQHPTLNASDGGSIWYDGTAHSIARFLPSLPQLNCDSCALSLLA